MRQLKRNAVSVKDASLCKASAGVGGWEDECVGAGTSVWGEQADGV